MKNNLKTLSFLLVLILAGAHLRVLGQANPLLPLADQQDAKIAQLQADTKISADAAFKLLTDWDNYSGLKATGKDYTWFYHDATFGQVPMRVYIPAGYRNNKKTPCILMLHGGEGGIKFSDIDSLNKGDDLYEVFKGLMDEGYIIIRPVADRSKKFDWAVNKWGNESNLTYKALNNMLISLKRVLNIDDSKVFAFGHSDGSDGATGLSVYDSRPYAGIVAYNSMLTNIFAQDFYIRNTVNRNFYEVHSDLDDLRPMLQIRQIINDLKATGGDVLYKEYLGYAHQDKHLLLDRPRVIGFMQQTKRDAFRNKIWWETNSLTYKTCDWLAITQLKADSKPAAWYKPYNVRSYNKIDKKFTDDLYYELAATTSAVKATYANNVFDIQTSRVGALEVKISPLMVDLKKPVRIRVNGKDVYNNLVKPDKQYLINSFKADFDRAALWVNGVKVAVN